MKKQFSRQFMIENFCSDQGLEKNEILMYTRILCNYQRLNYIWKYLQALILHSVVELVLQEGSKIKFLFFPLISPLGKTVFDISSMRRQQLFHQVISDSEVRKKNHTQKRNEEKKKRKLNEGLRVSSQMETEMSWQNFGFDSTWLTEFCASLSKRK